MLYEVITDRLVVGIRGGVEHLDTVARPARRDRQRLGENGARRRIRRGDLKRDLIEVEARVLGIRRGELEDLDQLGLLEGDLESAVVPLGVGYQLVTDYSYNFV